MRIVISKKLDIIFDVEAQEGEKRKPQASEVNDNKGRRRARERQEKDENRQD